MRQLGVDEDESAFKDFVVLLFSVFEDAHRKVARFGVHKFKICVRMHRHAESFVERFKVKFDGDKGKRIGIEHFKKIHKGILAYFLFRIDSILAKIL